MQPETTHQKEIKPGIESIPPDLRRECNDSAFGCYATAYIFERRARTLGYETRILGFLGLAGPATIGVVAISFSLELQPLGKAVVAAGVVGVIQFVAAMWSLISGWNRKLAYSLESKSENYRLAQEYEALANSTLRSERDFALKKQALDVRNDIRTNLDYQYHISDQEKRRGMARGLWRMRRACVECGQVPEAPNRHRCSVCGTRKKGGRG